MLKSHSNKKVFIVMALCLCLAMVAPAFMAPPAVAATGNSVSQAQTQGQIANANLGILKLTIDADSLGLVTAASMSRVAISFPTEVVDAIHDLARGGAGAPTVRAAFAGTGGIEIIVPASSGFAVADVAVTPVTNSKFSIMATNATGAAGVDGSIYVYFYGLDTRAYAGDFLVSAIPQPGSMFTQSLALPVGTVKQDAGTQTVPKSVFNVTGTGGTSLVAGVPTGNGLLNTITIFENQQGAITDGAIELKLMTKGYNWDLTTFGQLYDWGFGFGAAAPAIGVVGAGSDTLTLTNVRTGAPAAAPASAGLVHLTNLGVTVDDSVARVGQDIEVRIKGGGVTEQTFVVGKYCDFEAKVNEGTVTEIMAGREEQRIGEFYIEELAPGTLVQDRVITMELPEGYEWDNNSAFGVSNYEVVNSSAITLGNVRYPDRVGAAKNLGRVMKLEVTGDSAAAINGAKIKFKKLDVMVSPKAKGDLVIDISGKAGVEGTVKVATASPMVSMSAEPVDVVLGVQDQKVADVTLKELKADALVDRKDRTIADRTIVLQLDEDFAFAKVPKVEVVSGDIVLDMMAIRTAGDRDAGGQLFIPIKAGSLKTPAELKISEIYVTANRNAPEGPVAIKTAELRATANATNETGTFLDDRAASVNIANNKSVPPSENIGATTGEFNIGSNVYKINGLTKVMDAAPYLKNGRTYVPVRYLGYALGLTDADIVWDPASQKATLTKGSTVVELTVGSTTMTVNGEAKTIEVAPEKDGERVMLPARFVAEAFGAKVGWNAATKGVVVEN